MFQVALAGNLPDDEKILCRLDEHLGQIRAFISPDGKAEEIRFLFSPSLGSETWRNWMKKTDCAVNGYRVPADDRKDDICEETTYVETPPRGKIAEMILNQADLLLMVWNEDEMEMEGAAWETLRAVLHKNVPCIWVSARTCRQYWVEDTLYVPYQPEKLRKVCEMTVGVSLIPEKISRKRIPLLSMGTKLYKKFLLRYDADRWDEMRDRDKLLQYNFTLQEPFDTGEPLRKHLYEKFNKFEDTADDANVEYHSVLYLQAILPFIAIIFLSVGFFVPGILNALPVFPNVPWREGIAGLGFLVSAFIILCVFLAFRGKTVRGYHHVMVHNRRIAELLRVVIHFAPFGINLDLRRMSGRDFCLAAAVRRMIGEAEAPAKEVTQEDASQVLEYVREFLSDRFSYHYESDYGNSRIAKHLERMARVMLYIGLIIILLRCGQQFVMVFMDKGSANVLGQMLYGEVQVNTVISSAANMLAMIILAWAAYFAAKLSLGNFRSNQENHRRIWEELKEKLDYIEALKKSDEELSAEVLQDIGEGIAETLFMNNNEDWANF